MTNNFIGGLQLAGYDSGKTTIIGASSSHIVNDPKYLTNIRYFEKGNAPEFQGLMDTVFPTAIGDWHLTLGSKPIILTDTLLVPNNPFNIISQGLLSEQFTHILPGTVSIDNSDPCLGMIDITDPENKNVFAKRDPVDNVFYALIKDDP